jgi:hypothetical protein
MYYIRRY